jgi:hypothetical protein
MNVPENVRELIERNLGIIEADVASFNLSERIALLKAFGRSDYPVTFREAEQRIYGLSTKHFILTSADQAFCWLGIITARYVLPIWENYLLNERPIIEDDDGAIEDVTWLLKLPADMLNLAENVLLGKAEPAEIFRQTFQTHYYATVGHIHGDVTQKVASVCYAAYDALRLTFLGIPGMDYDNECIELNDEARRSSDCYDTSRMAMMAYSLVDENEPGYLPGTVEALNRAITALNDLFDENNPKYQILLDYANRNKPIWYELIKKRRFDENDPQHQALFEYINGYKPIWYDPVKKKQFWKWWLTVAIPQAWELAQQS